MRHLFTYLLVWAVATGPSLGLGYAQERPTCQTQPVVIYMTTWCPYCRQLREYLIARGAAFREIDIERSGPEAWNIGRSGVPITWTERGWIRGFEPAAFRQALCIR